MSSPRERLLVSVGCDRYDEFPALQGAEKDASDLYDLLRAQHEYDAGSVLLRSPTLTDFRVAAEKFTSRLPPPDILTFYFAGHGIARKGDYYLVLRGSRSNSMSVSALSMSALLSVLTEVSARQTHVIIDACKAGGGQLDLSKLLRSEIIGGRGSMSASFLVAAAATEYAEETKEGGVMTRVLLRFLNGDKYLHSSRPFLDLIEVGRAVSNEIKAEVSSQTPVAWGINLYGHGEFARNPHYAAGPGSPLVLSGVSPSTELGQRLAEMADGLWRTYFSISDEPDYAALVQMVVGAAEGVQEPSQAWSFIGGFSTALRSRASEAEDILTEYLVLCAFITALLPSANLHGSDDFAGSLLEELALVSDSALREVRDGLEADRHYLILRDNTLADLFFLPLRVMRLLGLVGVSHLTGLIRSPAARADADRIVDLLLRNYSGCLVTMSDNQAVDLYIFCLAGRESSWQEPARALVRRALDSFISVEARVARGELSGSDLLRYTLARSRDFSQIAFDLYQRPSDLLTALLLSAATLELTNELDRFLIALDHQTAGMMIPDTWYDYWRPNIENAVTRIRKVGHDFWTIGEHRDRCRDDLSTAPCIAEPLSEPWSSACLLASFLYRDRLPLFLEELP